MTDELEKRWEKEPPPGFKPDGTSMIVSSVDEIKWPAVTIKGPDGKTYTPEEWEAKEAAETTEAPAPEDDSADMDDDEFLQLTAEVLGDESDDDED